jgi:single-strand DNA-binding protein
MNNFTAIGRLTRDPEIKTTPNGISVTTFGIAIPRRSQSEKVDFFNVVTWRKTAEFAARNLTKGQRIGLSGEVQTRAFLDKTDQKRVVTEIVAHSIYFADSKNNKTAENTNYSEEINEDVKQMLAGIARENPPDEDEFNEDLYPF